MHQHCTRMHSQLDLWVFPLATFSRHPRHCPLQLFGLIAGPQDGMCGWWGWLRDRPVPLGTRLCWPGCSAYPVLCEGGCVGWLRSPTITGSRGHMLHRACQQCSNRLFANNHVGTALAAYQQAHPSCSGCEVQLFLLLSWCGVPVKQYCWRCC
jgi:hypothetical protein